ncbi:glutamine--fructose-6-phosphate transaminase (isomerizing) [Acidithrix ferrooxidans]|uniref:Glutamine--fructose-6-phosphate aminotransferase [isomerizing] n=2 Tax=root TaxID=1 RepID=A0A0D8HKP7_9ACTN|nr:glutamine--fructose-6-phosphate transaminase (isomerizing) [Acidithrix ferrooxidans]KJF18555.1 glutamine--fructose-6-phosphate aminotransferase [Acidithrix ferrooxidans]
MCGIIAVTGQGATVEVLTSGLKRLEYRGYDSAGIVVCDENGLFSRLRVAQGKNSLDRLDSDAKESEFGSIISGIGHTRWATHGGPTLFNAHPHIDCNGTISVVHNGIVENFRELKDDLISRGHIFSSETDTEVIAHLLEESLISKGSLVEAVSSIAPIMRGAMSFVAISSTEPGVLVGFKRMAPMVIGRASNTWFIASDIPAILDRAEVFYHLEDDHLVCVTGGGAEIFNLEGDSVDLVEFPVTWSLESAEKSGFDDFMSKEILEQPGALRDTLAGRLASSGELILDETTSDPDSLARINKVFIVACGTSYHAGMVAKYAIEHWTKVPVELDISSEFRYRDPVVDERTLVVAVSQSGETLDTLAALHEAKNLGAQTLAVCNVVGSSMARLADTVMYTRAGPEVGVAATKTHTAQIGALLLLALNLARTKGQLYPSEIDALYEELTLVPAKIQEVLNSWDAIGEVAKRFSGSSRFYFIGRHVGYPVALEGALKLKEISYLPAEGYPAGELKHGPIAMLDEMAVVVAIATRTRLYEKIVSNIEEVRARNSSVIIIGNPGDEGQANLGESFISVPRVHPLFAPLVDVVPLQIFAYHMARNLGMDVDRPRNLAKTVTVE